MQIQDYPYYSQPIAQPFAPQAKELKLEEVLRMLLFVLIGVYLMAHILFIPIEVLIFALFQDPALKREMYFIIGVYAGKYISIIIMFYAAHYHDTLQERHSHIELYIFSAICAAATGFFAFVIYNANEGFEHMGFASVFEHPVFYDFIGFACCGFLGTIYLFYMACTHPNKTAGHYTVLPAFDSYNPSFVPVPLTAYPAGSHARREAETVLNLDEQTRRQYMAQGLVPVVQQETVQSKPEQPKAPEKAAELPKMMPIYFVPQY